MKKTNLILFVLFFTSCGNVMNGLKPYQTIIQTDDKMDLVFGKNYQKWTPSASDIDIAEELLNQCIESQKKATVNRLAGRTLDEYNRQFVSAINEKGEKIIWINCFNKREESTFPDWKTKLVIVNDGGDFLLMLKLT